MTFFSKYGPASCDKKCCSEHQTLFAQWHARGSEHETILIPSCSHTHSQSHRLE